MIKASELLPIVIQLATDKPDTKAECRYFMDDGTPCCIVGHGLAAFGVYATPFLEDDDLNSWTGVYELNSRMGYLDADDSAAMLTLYRIQGGQDKGDTWGEALAHANEEIDE